jgi:hypothetical protein
VFDPAVTFRGDPTRDLNAAFVTGTRHRIFGGHLENPAGHGILVYPSSGNLWHGYTVGPAGGSCFRVFAVNGDVTDSDYVGTMTDCGNDLTLDKHGQSGGEYGTGLHPAYIGGDESQTGTVKNCRFVLDAHDCDTGAIQIGGKAEDNQFYNRGIRLNKVATQQAAGSPCQLFGNELYRNRIWVEGDTVSRVVETSGLGAGSKDNLVWHGRGTNVRLAPAYMPHPAVTYQDCTP